MFYETFHCLCVISLIIYSIIFHAMIPQSHVYARMYLNGENDVIFLSNCFTEILSDWLLFNTQWAIFQHIIARISYISMKIIKNERDPPLFTGKLLIKFQNILRNTTQVIIRHRVKILFSVISSPISLERQKWKSSKMKGILLSSPVSCW